jgi:hypothetical protein
MSKRQRKKIQQKTATAYRAVMEANIQATTVYVKTLTMEMGRLVNLLKKNGIDPYPDTGGETVFINEKEKKENV